MKLKAFDKGWLVGLLEADGTFTSDHKTVRIAVKMTDLDTVSRAATLLCTKVTGPYEYQGNDGSVRKPTYMAFISGKRARSWMIYLRPHMSLRRKNQIDILLGGQRELFEFARNL